MAALCIIAIACLWLEGGVERAESWVKSLTGPGSPHPRHHPAQAAGGGCFTLVSRSSPLFLTRSLGTGTNIAFLPVKALKERVQFKRISTWWNFQCSCASLHVWWGPHYNTQKLLSFKFIISGNASFDRQGLIIKLKYNWILYIWSASISTRTVLHNAIFGCVMYWVYNVIV